MAKEQIKAELRHVGRYFDLKEFYQDLKAEKPDKAIGFGDWITKYTYIKGKPFSFERHEYQRDIIEDVHPLQAIKKSVQLGVSEILIRKYLAFMAMYQGSQGIYIFPTAEDMSNFVKTRVDPAIKNCPKIDELGFNVDNVKVKQIGSSYAHFRGSFGEKETISIPSDINIIDEMDFAKPNIANLYRSRLEHSSFKWEINCSTPTIPQHGIDKLFDDSDQRYWHIKCSHCNKWVVLAWLPDKRKIEQNNIRIKGKLDNHINEYDENAEYIFVCTKCHKEIRYSPDIPMEWVAKYPSRKKIRGYFLNSLASWGYRSAGSIIDSFYGYKEVDKAYNRILGLAYSDPGRKLSRDVILRCVINSMEMQDTGRNCFLAADQGDISWVVIGEYDREKDKIKVLYFEKVEKNLFDHVERTGQVKKGRLSQLMDKFDVISAVIDAQPNTESAHAFAKQFPGKVWLCFYSDKQMAKYTWKPEEYVVIANRTRTLDYSMNYWIDKKVEIFPENNYNYEIYEILIKHLTSMTKVIDEDADGTRIARWTGPKDTHFAHVWNYLAMATEAESTEVSRVILPGISGFSMKK